MVPRLPLGSFCYTVAPPRGKRHTATLELSGYFHHSKMATVVCGLTGVPLSLIEVLTPSVTVFGVRACEEMLKGRTLINPTGLVPLQGETLVLSAFTQERPHEHRERRLPSASQGESPHQEPNRQAPRSWAPQPPKQ